MLRLNDIALTHFKNYEFSRFLFEERIVGISGLNGRGKTTLLDAIYYCCFTKSYFSTSDNNNIRLEKDGFRIEANFENGQSQKTVCVYKGSKKNFFLNDVPYTRLSKHIGLLPAVIIAPDDIEIITGSSEHRRKFLDIIVCQLYPEYLEALITYNKLLAQRNSLLKQIAETGKLDSNLLDIIDTQLAKSAIIVYEYRKEISVELKNLIESFYHRIGGGLENVEVAYKSQLSQGGFRGLLKQNLQKDIALARTTIGIHRDDLQLSMLGISFKEAASQGQRKTLLFAMKLAEFDIIKNHLGFTPLLLLDDVFEKLDEVRMKQLLEWVALENDGQVFITDTHRTRLEKSSKN